MVRRLTTVAACRVARIDRQRFNEFVSGDRPDYTCAPETTPGRARLFDENDIIALAIFAAEIDKQTKPSVAGRIAAYVRDTLNARPDADTVAVGRSLNTAAMFALPPEAIVARLAGRGSPVLSSTIYNVASIRDFVREGIDEEFSVAGEND